MKHIPSVLPERSDLPLLSEESSSLEAYPQMREELRERLLQLSFHAFAQCLCQLLSGKGYSSVHLLDRTEWRQFTRHGGVDIEAFGKAGVVSSKVLVQIKQYRRPVHRRFVDELRGVTLRKMAGHALLMTTSTFSEPAKAAALHESIVPVRLVSGEELLDWLIQGHIGIWEEQTHEGDTRWQIDYAYFEELECLYPSDTKRRLTRSR